MGANIPAPITYSNANLSRGLPLLSLPLRRLWVEVCTDSVHIFSCILLEIGTWDR